MDPLPDFIMFIYYLFLRKSGIWMSFFGTVLVGALVPNCVEFIVGRLKLGILRFMLLAGDGLVFLAAPNTELEALFPNGVF